MHRNVRNVLLVLAFCFAIIAGGFVVKAASTPCVGDHIATQTEADSVGKGIIAGVSHVCPGDVQLGISASVGEAKKYLVGIAQGLQRTQAPPDAAHIDKLSDAMAVCSANFLMAYTHKYGAITISSAFRCGPRTPANVQCNRNENATAGGAGGSNHQVGLAIDVNPANGDYKTLWKFASANPQFGVCFPHQDGGANTTGYADRPHMILAGIGGTEGAACAKQGVTKACSGAPPTNIVTPSLSALGGPPKPGDGLGGAISTVGNDLNNALNSGYGGGSYGPTNTSGTGDITPGTVLGTDYYCVTNLNPPTTFLVPAGTPLPSGCINNGVGAQQCTNAYNLYGYSQCAQMQPQCAQGSVLLASGQCLPLGQQQQQQPPPPPQQPQQSQQQTPQQQQAQQTQSQTPTQSQSGSQFPQQTSLSPQIPQITPISTAPINSSCTLMSIICPVGSHDQTSGGTCSHQCVSDTASQKPSTIDQISQIANSTSTSPSSPASQNSSPSPSPTPAPSPVTLNPDTKSVIQLLAQIPPVGTVPPVDTSQKIADSGNIPQSTIVIHDIATGASIDTGASATTSQDSGNDTSGVIKSVQPTSPQASHSTFTSGDLGASGQPQQAPQQAPQSSSTFLFNVLENLKNSLLNALQLLKPFGGTVRTY